jgi:enoyl-CoA hydratase/carnithine racemase
MAYKGLRLEFDGNICRLTLDNPPRNTLPLVVSDQFADVAEKIRSSAARVLILTGSGQYFCAGAEPADLAREATGWEMKQTSARAHRNLRALCATGRPIVGAINGLCMGFGLELALTCHLRIASARARFAAPEVSYGFFPTAGGTQLLPRLVGRARAYELMLTGDSIRADEAHRWGLVNRVVKAQDCLSAATHVARCIASKGALALASILEAVDGGLELPLAEGLRIEANLIGVLENSPDLREGLRAFAEERVPEFRERLPV